MKHIEVVGAAIIKDGKLFSTQRGYGPQKGSWEFPGGKIEPAETPEQALTREIREELDTEVSIIQKIGESEHTYPQFHVHFQLFECSVVSGSLTLKEHEDARWLTPETINEVDWLPADLPLLDSVRTVLSNHQS